MAGYTDRLVSRLTFWFFRERDVREAAAARRGETKGFDPARVALVLAEGTSAILQRRLEEAGRTAEEDVEWIVDLLLNGLCPGRRS